jgi:O-antigen biosynthesis protein
MLGSIIIPTLGRKDCLRDCLESLWAQSNQDFEIVLVKEEGELAALRNEGAHRARGKYLIFIDDDVVCYPGWFSAIVRTFESGDISGVSGPAVVRGDFRRNRDVFKFGWINHLFMDGRQMLPGHISRAGAWTTGATNEDCSYEGPVQFLEACNMAYRSDAFRLAGGFDETYKGVGDWSEPDLAFRIREAGGSLWFSRDARLEHRASKSGAFKKRRGDARNRMANYELFASRWIKPNWRHSLYKFVLKKYYETQTFK